VFAFYSLYRLCTLTPAKPPVNPADKGFPAKSLKELGKYFLPGLSDGICAERPMQVRPGMRKSVASLSEFRVALRSSDISVYCQNRRFWVSTISTGMEHSTSSFATLFTRELTG
jgi:hypothetical protein